MNLFEELKWRGLIHNITDEKIIDKINNEKLTLELIQLGIVYMLVIY